MSDNDVKALAIAGIVVMMFLFGLFKLATVNEDAHAKKYESCISAQIASSVDLKCGEIK